MLEYVNKVLRILAPILYGCAIAYLLSPVVNWFERAIFRHGGHRAPAKWVRAGSLVLTWIVVAAFLYGPIIPAFFRDCNSFLNMLYYV